MKVYSSPTEPALRNPSYSLTSSALCERNGCDFLVHTPKGFAGFQRKTLPDLVASLMDGRLYFELAQLRSSPLVAYPFLILEADLSRRTIDGDFMDTPNFAQHTLWSLLTKVQINRVHVLHTLDTPDTITCIRSVSSYITKTDPSELRRPTPALSSWGIHTSKDYQMYLLQSFPGIGPRLAEAIVQHFGKAPLTWAVTEADLLAVPGLGKEKIRRMFSALGPLDKEQLV